jgi:nucleotide-binding universal stress UspA family protein
MTSTPPVVVAVGPEGSPAAVRYGAREALRRDRGLLLVHATGPVDGPQTSHRRTEDSARLLATVERRALAEVAGLVPVATRELPGFPVPAVVEAGREAALLVVGRRPTGRRPHPQLRSVADGITASARTSVACVPESWLEGQVRDPLVVVGVDPARISTDSLLEAYDAARSRRARIRLVVAWWRPTGADRRTALGSVDETQGADLLATEVAQATVGLRAWYADVPTEVAVIHQPAAEALVAASRTADLLVLGRHEPWLPSGSCIGPVARDVAHESGCPVLLTAALETHQVQATPSPVHG